MSSYNLKNKQTIQISGLILQYCSATTLYRRLVLNVNGWNRYIICFDTHLFAFLFQFLVETFQIMRWGARTGDTQHTISGLSSSGKLPNKDINFMQIPACPGLLAWVWPRHSAGGVILCIRNSGNFQNLRFFQN